MNENVKLLQLLYRANLALAWYRDLYRSADKAGIWEAIPNFDECSFLYRHAMDIKGEINAKLVEENWVPLPPVEIAKEMSMRGVKNAST